MKRKILLLIVTLMLAAVSSFLLVGCGDYPSNGYMFSGSSRNADMNRVGSTFRATANSINGNVRMSVVPSGEQLHITSSHSGGTVTLEISQENNDITETVVLTSPFSDSIRLNDFETGSIRLRIHFANAQGVSLTINWGTL